MHTLMSRFPYTFVSALPRPTFTSSSLFPTFLTFETRSDSLFLLPCLDDIHSLSLYSPWNPSAFPSESAFGKDGRAIDVLANMFQAKFGASGKVRRSSISLC